MKVSVAFWVCAGVCAAGCGSGTVEGTRGTNRPAAATGAEADADEPELIPLGNNVWIHRSFADIPPWGRVSANGLLLVGPPDALLVDTPWNDEQTAQLFESVKRRFGVPVRWVIATHAHEDNLGGLAEAHRLGARSVSLAQTIDIATAAGKPVPQQGFSVNLMLNAAGTVAELFYPGPAHAPDNIAVNFPEFGILFGGCLIKAADAQSVGNTADADLSRWAASVDTLADRFAEAVTVVPGHGDAGGRALFEHTKAIVSAHRP